MWLAEETPGTGASVQSTFRLQFPGDEVQQLTGGVMAELPLHRQGRAHREQQAWSQPRVTVRIGRELDAALLPQPQVRLELKTWKGQEQQCPFRVDQFLRTGTVTGVCLKRPTPPAEMKRGTKAL